MINWKLCILVFVFLVNNGHCGLISTGTNRIHGIIDNNLLVFVAYYDPLCIVQGQPGLTEFERVSNAVEELGHARELNITFVKVDIKQDVPSNERTFGHYICGGDPNFALFRYGNRVEYGYEGSLEKMMAWLHKKTEHVVVKITSRQQLEEYVRTQEFSIIGYFKNAKIWRHFYTASDDDSLKGARFADVQNSAMVNEYPRDSVVINQEFGKIQIILDEDLTATRIIEFVKANVNITEPINHVMRDVSRTQLENIIKKTAFVFVQFYHKACPIAGMFESAAQIGHDNGMTEHLDMKFVTLNITKYPGNLTTYKISKSDCRSDSPWDSPHVMRLFRYGKMIKYAGSLVSQNTIRLEGLLNWLEQNTKPVVKGIDTWEDLNLIVNYHETSIIGYFKDGSTAKNPFRATADELKQYAFGEVASVAMNPYSEDIIILFREFGESSNNHNLTDNLTPDRIKAFILTHANQDHPVPTRPIPTPPPDSFFRNASQIAIFDAVNFKGNSMIVQLSDDCTEIPEDWGRGTWSIKTFGQCVDFFEDSGCLYSSKNFRLDMTEYRHADIASVKPTNGFRSLDFCSKWKSQTSLAIALSYSTTLYCLMTLHFALSLQFKIFAV